MGAVGEGVKAGPERDQGSELELRLLVEGEWRRGAEPGRAASERWVRPGATPAAAEHRAGLGAGGRVGEKCSLWLLSAVPAVFLRESLSSSLLKESLWGCRRRRKKQGHFVFPSTTKKPC